MKLFFLFRIWLWAVFHFFKGILGPVPRTVLHEIVTALSIVYLQCKVMLRKYTVIKQQKEAFGKPPSILPNIVGAWGKFVPCSPLISFLSPCRSVGEYVPFLPSWVCLCWFGSFKCFLNSKMHEIYEDIVCQKQCLWHKYILCNPWAPTIVLSILLLCVNGNGIEKIAWRHYGILAII